LLPQSGQLLGADTEKTSGCLQINRNHHAGFIVDHRFFNLGSKSRCSRNGCAFTFVTWKSHHLISYHSYGKISAVVATNPTVFLKEVRTEMEKVSWPSRQEAIRLTLIVVATSMAIGIYIGGLDFGFTKIMEFLVKR